MLTRIESSDAYWRFLTMYRQHNNACPTEYKTRIRRRSDGTTYEQKVPYQVGTLSESIKTTFHALLTQYIYNYNRVASEMPAGMYSPADPPSLLTNSVHLAEFCDCSDRTVRNHLSRLRDLGAIRTKFHGRKHDYELWISGEILFGGEGENFQKIPQNELLEGFSKKFPANYTHREIIEKEKGNAEMFVEHGENSQGQRGRTDKGAQPEPHPSESSLPVGRRERIGAGARAEIVAHNAQKRQSRAAALLDARKPRTPRGLDPKFLNMLVEFWLYAWKVVYPHREFSREQQEHALVAIMAGVYNNFEDQRSDKEWVDFQVYQLSKLDKAGRYYDNHPDAYRPDPYAVHVPGKGYFDAVNLKGFQGIDAWIRKDSIKNAKSRQDYADAHEKKVKRCEALLRTARRDFEKLRAGQKPRKEVAGKNQIALFQYYHVIFEGQGAKWAKAFAQQFLDQQACDFLPPKYFKPKRQRHAAGEMHNEVTVYVEDWMHDGEGYYSE